MDRQTSFIHGFFHGAGDTVDGFVDGPGHFFNGGVVGHRGKFHFDFDFGYVNFYLRGRSFYLYGRLTFSIRFGWMARRWRRWARRSTPRHRRLFPT